MAPDRDRRPIARAGLLVALVAMATVIVGTIGWPLVGKGMFHGAAMVYAQYPWREDRPPDLQLNYGPIADTVDSTMPNRDEFAERARDGELALWNPYIAGGAPLGSTSQSGVMSPMNLPFLVLPPWAAPAWTKFIEMAVAGGFTFLFLRRLGIGRVAAILAGSAYMTSGFAVAWNNWQQPQVAALIPALFWATERHLQERRLSTTVPISLALGVMAVSGFPAVAAYSLFLLIPYVGWRVLERAWAEWPAERWVALRRRVAVGLTAALGLALGLSLAAFVLLPFQNHLDTLALGWRNQVPRFHLPIENLATAVVPNALGAAQDELLIGTVNTVEALSFVGVIVVLLAAAALLLRPPERTPRGVRAFFAVALLITVWLTFVGGPVLDAVQNLPVFDTNYVARLRSMFGFEMAVLAGIGGQAVLERRLPTNWKGWVFGSAAVVVLCGFFLAAFLSVNDLAQAMGKRHYVADQARIPLFVGILGLGIVVTLLWRKGDRTSSLRRLGVASLALLFAVEALALVVPRLPREDEKFFYPEMPAHEFLADHLDAERVAPTGRTLYVSANTMYDMRAITGHTHHQQTWAQLIKTADPDSFPSPTFSSLSPLPEVMTSPILDRLAARYFVSRPTEIPPGPVTGTDPARDEVVTLDAHGVSAEIPAQPLRAITVRLAEPVIATTEDVRLHVDVTADDGTEVQGTLRIYEAGPSDFTVPIAGEDLPATGTLTVNVSATGRPALGIRGSDGEPTLGWIGVADDDLDLVFTEGALIYERDNALPRVRWASQSEIIADPKDREAALAAGVDPDTVVLESGSAGGDGQPATIEVTQDDPETVTAQVDADGAGWLVVADAKQNSWVAELDGEPTPLVNADHALVAVAVPDGDHEVRLVYQPEGRSTGLKVSVLAALALVALAVVPLVLDRRRRRGPTAAPGPKEPEPEAGAEPEVEPQSDSV